MEGEGDVQKECVVQESEPNMKPVLCLKEELTAQSHPVRKPQAVIYADTFVGSQIKVDSTGNPNAFHLTETNSHGMGYETCVMMPSPTREPIVSPVVGNFLKPQEFNVDESLCNFQSIENAIRDQSLHDECSGGAGMVSAECRNAKVTGGILSSEVCKPPQGFTEVENIMSNDDKLRSFSSEACLSKNMPEVSEAKSCSSELKSCVWDISCGTNNDVLGKYIAKTKTMDNKGSEECVGHNPEEKLCLPNMEQINSVQEGEMDCKIPIAELREKKVSVLPNEKVFNVQYLSGNIKRGQRMMPGTWRKSRRRKNCSRERKYLKVRKECMVPGCFYRACSSRFVDFPLDPDQRQAWAEETRLGEKFPEVDPQEPLPLRIGLCMGHFREEDFHVVPRGASKLCSLKEGTSPSLFPWVEGAGEAIRSGLDIFKGDKCSREAKLLSVMKQELDDMLNPPNRNEFIVNTYQPRRKSTRTVPPLKIRLKACVESVRKKKEARAQRKLLKEREREMVASAVVGEEVHHEVKVEPFEPFCEDMIERTPSFEGQDMSSPIDPGAQMFSGLNHFLAPCFNGEAVGEQGDPHILSPVNLHLITSCVQAAISPMMARLEAFQEKVETRMEHLEGKVTSRLELLEEKVNSCLERLSGLEPKTEKTCQEPETPVATSSSDKRVPGEVEVLELELVAGSAPSREGDVTPCEGSGGGEVGGDEPASLFVDSSVQEMTMDIQPFAISEREYEMMERDDIEVQIQETL